MVILWAELPEVATEVADILPAPALPLNLFALHEGILPLPPAIKSQLHANTARHLLTSPKCKIHLSRLTPLPFPPFPGHVPPLLVYDLAIQPVTNTATNRGMFGFFVVDTSKFSMRWAPHTCNSSRRVCTERVFCDTRYYSSVFVRGHGGTDLTQTCERVWPNNRFCASSKESELFQYLY